MEPKYIESLPIVKWIGKVAYKVKLPLWCKIYNILHVGVTRPYFVDKEDASRNKLKRHKLKKARKRVLKLFLHTKLLGLPRTIKSIW